MVCVAGMAYGLVVQCSWYGLWSGGTVWLVWLMVWWYSVAGMAYGLVVQCGWYGLWSGGTV